MVSELQVRDRQTCMAWVRSGTAFFLEQLDTVDLSDASRLPDWTKGHVAAHVARNAEALVRLLTWARTGVETKMYPSREARAADIERDSSRPRDVQLADVRATAALFEQAVAELTEPAWAFEVRGASGRVLPVTRAPWMRVLEVWLHAVDLGAALSAVPPDLVDAMLGDVTRAFADKAEPPGLHLTTPAGRTWTVGDGAAVVVGEPVELLSWLIGRGSGAGLKATGELPELPAWL